MIKTVHQLIIDIPVEVSERFYHTDEFHCMFHTAAANAVSSSIDYHQIIISYDSITDAIQWDKFLNEKINEYKEQL